MFWPEIARPGGTGDARFGAAFTIAAVVLSAIGSLVASRNRARGVPLLAAFAYGMRYGVDNGWVGDEVALIIEFEARRK